jgi:hypothetical protein
MFLLSQLLWCYAICHQFPAYDSQQEAKEVEHVNKIALKARLKLEKLLLHLNSPPQRRNLCADRKTNKTASKWWNIL